MKNRQKPAIRFKGFTEDWEQRKLGEISLRESTIVESSDNNPSVEYEDVVSDEGRLNKDIQQKDKQKNGIAFNSSHILYGKLRPYLHNWLNPDFNGVAVGDWWVLKPNTIDKNFLYRLIQTEQFDNVANQSSGSKMPRADWNLVSNAVFAIPHSIAEQSKIAKIFTNLDNLITLHQRKYDKLVNIKKSMLEKMFPREGKNVPDIRFSGFTEDWEQRKLGEISLRESTIVESSDNNPSVEYEDVVSDEGRLNKDIQQKDKQKNGIAFNSSHILYGKLRPYLHNWLNPDFNGVAVGDWWVLKPNTIDKNFLYRLIQTEQFDNVANQSSGSKMPRADWNLVSNAVFAIPHSIAEQSKIAKIFTNLDNLITLHQRKYDKLVNIKKSMLEKMFPREGKNVPDIRFSGFTEDWEQRKLGELALFNPKDELPQIFEYVDLESVVGTEMLSHRTEIKSSAPSRAQRIARTGDLFYQTVRPYQKNNYLFEKPDNNYVFSTGYAQMRPFVDGYFMLSLVQSERFIKVVLDNCTGTSYPAINSNNLAEIEVYAPSNKKEDNKIGTIFRNIDNLITLHQRKLEKLKYVKKSCLEKMFI